jgi:hypothetical protein
VTAEHDLRYVQPSHSLDGVAQPAGDILDRNREVLPGV